MPPPRLSPEAEKDIQQLYLYGVLTYGPTQADVYLAQLHHLILLYAENPFAAAERDEIRPPIRMFRSGAHHVFYDVIDGGVVVQRILHHATDWMTIL